jgi:hypothetical protein
MKRRTLSRLLPERLRPHEVFRGPEPIWNCLSPACAASCAFGFPGLVCAERLRPAAAPASEQKVAGRAQGCPPASSALRRRAPASNFIRSFCGSAGGGEAAGRGAARRRLVPRTRPTAPTITGKGLRGQAPRRCCRTTSRRRSPPRDHSVPPPCPAARKRRGRSLSLAGSNGARPGNPSSASAADFAFAFA